MSARSSEILNEILMLSPQERAELVDEILASFGAGPSDSTLAKWAIEAESRIDAIESGEMGTSPAEEVFARFGKSV